MKERGKERERSREVGKSEEWGMRGGEVEGSVRKRQGGNGGRCVWGVRGGKREGVE